MADTTPAVMYKHVHEPLPLDELPSDLPQGVVAVVEKALAKKREARYQSAGEMAQALRAAIDTKAEPKVERKEKPTVQGGLPIWGWGVIALVAALVIGGALFLTIPAGGPTATPVPVVQAATPTATVTATVTPMPPTDTLTSVPPTATPMPPTKSTSTSTPTKTPTPVPPTATPTPEPTPEPLPPVLERVQPFEPEMVLIPAGEFLMGSDPSVDKYAQVLERLQHALYLPDYYMARTEVTNAQYAAFVQATGHAPPAHWEGGKPPGDKEDHPVVNVTWYDAVAYCNWLAEVTGRPYRLPSEAEWEKGARGTDGRIFPWGNQWDTKRCNTAEGGPGDTTPVGTYPEDASPYGLLDMAGNVSEWTRNIGRDYPYDPDDGREDLNAKGWRVFRGGAWISNGAITARCFRSSVSDPTQFFGSYGLRVVVSARSLP